MKILARSMSRRKKSRKARKKPYLQLVNFVRYKTRRGLMCSKGVWTIRKYVWKDRSIRWEKPVNPSMISEVVHIPVL